MRTFVLILILALSATAAWAQGNVSLPLAYQINASATGESAEKLSVLTRKENTTGVAIGQWMEFDFGKPNVVTRLTVVNGWADSGEFKRMGRVRTMTLQFSGGGKQTITLKDSPKPQSFAIKATTSSVRMTVTEVYGGGTSEVPYLSGVSFEGFDPELQQVTLTGRFEGCVRSRSNSSWEGSEDPLYYCSRFRADDGRVFGCMDDLCFHTKDLINVRLQVTAVVRPGNVLEVLAAQPAK